jgi:signal peptidase II
MNPRLSFNNMPPSLIKVMGWFFLMVIVTLPIDQLTKFWSTRNFLIYEDQSDTTLYQGRREEIFTISGDDMSATIQLTYVRNHGASWGVLSQQPEPWRVPFLLLSGFLFAGVMMAAAMSLQRRGQTRLAQGLVLLIAGGVGNTTDRIYRGYVVDFLSVKWQIFSQRMSIPAFNVADIIIVFALFLILHQSARLKPQDGGAPERRDKR